MFKFLEKLDELPTHVLAIGSITVSLLMVGSGALFVLKVLFI